MDLSVKPGNPAYDFNKEYRSLMLINDIKILRAEAIKIADTRRGHGMSENSYKKFIYTINKINNLDDMKFYITNFLLKASGLGVVESEAEVVAGLIGESPDEVHQFTEAQIAIAAVVESYGYKVTILEE